VGTLIVANRLPVTIHWERGNLRVEPSAGGLATALRSLQAGGDVRWIGWPGDISRTSETERQQLDARFRELKTIPVYLSQAECTRFYDNFSNGVLWPLCHYLLDKVRIDAQRDWVTYRQVNERFARIAVEHYQPGDTIWVHDYQLALVPAFIRAMKPDAKIGFFLHIPFPAADVFRILPWREELMRGLLGADLVGFHTASYAFHFTYSAAQLVGVEPTTDTLQYEDRSVRVGAYPISIDTSELDRLARSTEVEEEVAALREKSKGKTIILGVDRLDYTKGVIRRMMAVERLLEREPSLREKLHFIQLAVPTRERVEGYAEYRRTVNELVSKINGQYGTPMSAPIHLLYRSVTPETLAALYRSADVMLVTPLRDGMNLVAKEYVACRTNQDGVLIISEFAGAAVELREALHVNPYDLDAVATAISRAVTMSGVEQQVRMQALRARVSRNDVHRWAANFLTDLQGAETPARARSATSPDIHSLSGRIAELRSAPKLLVLLDYDGTLVPFAPLPELAIPDTSLINLLQDLGTRPNTSVHLISGRSRESLEQWFGQLPIGLHGEHGYWSRSVPGSAWIAARMTALDWKQEVLQILTDVTRRTDGSALEEKTASVAWHYRATEPQLAFARLREVRARLEAAKSKDAFELLEGSKVLEARLRGINKGNVVRDVLESYGDSAVLAAGDDITDEELFAALPPHALSIHVGTRLTKAGFRVSGPAELRMALKMLLTLPSSIPAQ
jgi:trehalose 6-phosphate synthase/phosphatase